MEAYATLITLEEVAMSLLKMSQTSRSIWVIPYQFTEVSHMTLSELDETWWVGSPSELM